MNLRRRHWLLAAAAASFDATAQAAPALDHSYTAWTALLRKHVVVQRGGQASVLRYAALAAERDGLKAVLDALSSVPRPAFEGFSRAQRQAFLINAYNAFTVELVLTRYPDLRSIKDIGGLFGSPWKPAWIALLGDKVSLDDIEHGMLRARGAFDDPRIHFAVNCASIGCPMLREEAYVAGRLDAQLDEQTTRFMSDRTRNRYNAGRSRLELSKIFDWYAEDFKLGHRGIVSLPSFAARHADVLADLPADRERVRAGVSDIAHTDYDWSLNSSR